MRPIWGEIFEHEAILGRSFKSLRPLKDEILQQ